MTEQPAYAMPASQLRLGVHFPPTFPPERLPEFAQAADRAGLDEIWVWEDCFKQSGIASAAAALAWTERITVGIGLLPVPLRNVALEAMEFATLARMFPGRLIAGIGHGVQSWIAQAGARVGSPLTLLREHAEALRLLLGGETVTTRGHYVQLDDVCLDWPPPIVPPLMIGGVGPKSLSLAAEFGDGNLLSGMTEEQQAEACRSIRRSQPDSNHAIVSSAQLVTTGTDAEQRLDRAMAGIPNGGGIAGDAADLAAVARRYASVGITSFGVYPASDEPELAAFAEFVGRQVRPLIDENKQSRTP